MGNERGSLREVRSRGRGPAGFRGSGGRGAGPHGSVPRLYQRHPAHLRRLLRALSRRGPGPGQASPRFTAGPAPGRGDGRGVCARRRPEQPALRAPGPGRPPEAHALALRPLDTSPDRDRAPVDRRGRPLAGGGGGGDRVGGARGAGASHPPPRDRPRGRAPSRVQPRRPSDPGRQLLRLPWTGPESPADGPAPGPRGGRQGAAPFGPRRDRPREPGEERSGTARHGPGRAEADAPRLERQGPAERGPDPDAAPVDRGGRRVAASLVVHPARPALAAGGAARRLAEEPGRCLRPRRDREAGAAALSRSGPARAAPPPELRPRRTAPQPGGGPRISRGQVSRCLRPAGGPPASFT